MSIGITRDEKVKFHILEIQGPTGPSFQLLRRAGGWAFGPITIQAMDDLGRLKGRYPENFVLISQLEVCQEGWIKKGGTWRTLSISDWRHG